MFLSRRNTIEAVKDALEVLRCNTYPLVGDTQTYFNIIRLQLDFDRSTRRGVGHCVIEQVVDGLLDTQCIALHNDVFCWVTKYKLVAQIIHAPAFYQLFK